MVAARPLLGVTLGITLAGCSMFSKKEPPPPPSFDTVMSEAEAQVNAGPDGAVAAFEEAAKSDPTRKEPWVRIAQLQFDRGNYARAIVAAEEVLQRDPDDLVADGVMTVAGFRIANQSLQRLQGRGALSSDTARTEAKTLADTLRATMGDAVIEPEKEQPKRTVRRTRRAATPAPAAATQPAARPAASQPANADPFKNVGGN
nr:tetratricopeptide repeat protein [Stenotrophomonas tumulicola]